MSLRRLDFGSLRIDAGKKRTPNGFLECDALIARTGVQIYHRPDGSERREYRPPDEVFKADALTSAVKVPITFTPDMPNWHPPEPVTADNADRYQAGITGSEAKADGRFVKTTALIFKADAIKAAESGDFAQLSCGYSCDLEMTPGTTPEGEKYDGIQRNIRVNHVAMVRAARAGPEARLHLDADDNAVQHDPTNLPAPKESPMAVKIRIDGIECEVSETAAALIAKRETAVTEQIKQLGDDKTKAEKAHADALSTLKTELERTKAAADAEKIKADAAAKKLEEAEKARKDAEDPKKLQAAIAARVDLEGKARAILGDAAKLSEKTDAEVKRDVVAKAMPSIKLDGKGEAYVEALFDRAVADFEEEHPMSKTRRAAGPPPTKKEDGAEGEQGDEDLTADSAFTAMVKANKDASKPKAATK